MRGNETDLYNNEQYEIIIDILKEYLAKSTVPDSRRADIILSVLEANHADGTPENTEQSSEILLTVTRTSQQLR